MTPVFDKFARCVAWIDGRYLFDTKLNWVAFLSGEQVFAATSVNWLGVFHEGFFTDTEGKPVAWLAGSSPRGVLKPLKPIKSLKPLPPLRPIRPRKPLTPLKPAIPSGGWSLLNFADWIDGRHP